MNEIDSDTIELEKKMNTRNLGADSSGAILYSIPQIRFLSTNITNISLSASEMNVEETTREILESEPKENLLGPEQMAGYAVTAIFVIIGLITSYLILKRFLFKPVITVINKRRETVLAELTEASEKSIQAQTLMENAQTRIDASKEEASDIIMQARIQAEKQAESIVEKAKKDADEVIQKAERETKHTHDVMLDQMRDEISDLAVSVATKVIGSVIDESRQKKLSEKILDETLNAEVKNGE